MTRPRLLDLFAGAGGCSVGYQRAGFDVTGVDIEAHPDYPLGELIVADALEVLADTAFVATFDAVHASPPCQAHTTMSNRWRGTGTRADDHLNLIPAVRDGLIAAAVPYVIENVVGARQHLRGPVLLSGGMFGLRVQRPRLFESTLPIVARPDRGVIEPIGVYGKTHDGRRLWTRADGTTQRAARSLTEAREAMGIDWMAWEDLTEAIPPAYTEWIGLQLLDQIDMASVTA